MTARVKKALLRLEFELGLADIAFQHDARLAGSTLREKLMALLIEVQVEKERVRG